MSGGYRVEALSEGFDEGQDAVDKVGLDHQVHVEFEVVQRDFFAQATRKQLVVVKAGQCEEQTQVFNAHTVEREARLELLEASSVSDDSAERKLVLVGQRLHVGHGLHQAAVQAADVGQPYPVAHDHFPEDFAEPHVEDALVEDAAAAYGAENAPSGSFFRDSQQASHTGVAGSREQREVVGVSPHSFAALLEVVSQQRVELESRTQT